MPRSWLPHRVDEIAFVVDELTPEDFADIMPKKKSVPGLSELEVTTRLRTKYSGEEWAFFTQVPDQTGRARRYADAIAMNLWRSRGFVIHGFEIKSARADLLNEIKKPKKADAIAKFCDYWWLVIGHKSLIKETDIIPKPWGIMVPHGSGLRIVKKAEHLEPVPPNIGFVASLMRQAKRGSTSKDELEEAYREGKREGRKVEKNYWKGKASDKDKSGNPIESKSKKILDEFRERTGISLASWNVGDVAKLYKAMNDTSGKDFLRQLKSLNREMRKYRGQHTVAKRNAQAIIEHLEEQGIEVPLNLKV